MLKLTEAKGLFVARNIVIRNQDTLHVTKARCAQRAKAISLLAAPLTPIANVATFTGGI